MKLIDLKNKSVLILGLGREGLSTYRILRRLFPQKKLGLADISPQLKRIFSHDKRLSLHLGQNYLKSISRYGVIIKSPGVPPQLIKTDSILTSQTGLFFDNFTGKIIGVTGTKGKSTTASLICHLLKTAGFKVKIGGNIGKPPLELLDKKLDWAVLELSSHQLWNLKKSPHIAVFLNIYPEHLDYSDFSSYFQAKQNITLWQNEDDYFIYNGGFPKARWLAQKTKARSLAFGPAKLANEQNIQAAIAVAKVLGIKNHLVSRAIKTFKPLRGRLENIGTYRKITFYDDCLATIPQATLNALKTFSGKVGALFLGGWERHQDFTPVINEAVKQKIPLLILFPPAGERVKKELEIRNLRLKIPIQWFLVRNMKEAVKLVYKHSPPGKIALFSTGAPSFGLFKDYKHRSKQFRGWVRKLGR